MIKLVIIFTVLVVGYIAYTGVDVTDEYNSVSNLRNDAYTGIVDPLAKKVLKQVSEVRLDQKIDSAFAEYLTEDETEDIVEEEEPRNIEVDRNNDKIEITIYLEDKKNE